MVFDLLLYISLGIFSLGLVFKFFTWFSRKIGYGSEKFTTFARLAAAVKGIAGILFSLKLLTLIKVFILDVIFQIDPFGDFDLLFGAAKLNLKIVEVPVRYRSRTYGDTNISRWRHGWMLLKMVVFAAKRIKFV